MRVAVTGGTGFIGRHLAAALAAEGHSLVLVARGADRRNPGVHNLSDVRFVPGSVADGAILARAFEGCDAVAHCAGINRERGEQTYERVHVQGTAAVVGAARAAGVSRLVFVSFLRARPRCGSPYHESKWAAEEIVRASGLQFTVLKQGVTYGMGDHMLAHLGRAVRTLPLFATVGIRVRTLRPVAVEDTVRVLRAGLVSQRLANQTVAVTGPEELTLGEVARRVAHALGRRVVVFPLPTSVHYALAWTLERLLSAPLVSVAQVRMLAEGVSEPLPPCDALPEDLVPQIRMTEEQVKRGLPTRR